ncbi:MAG: hypothetical protein KAW88_05295 [Candidatus Cloacimonetes bacterium]|nr:hypothetical protein [Candidatus Cloacimonadota bacterium]
MKKVLWLLALMGIILAGCSEDGTLRITNNSNYSAWFQLGSGGSTNNLNSGQVYEKDYTLSTSIFGDEDKKVTVYYGGDFVFSNQVNKTIRPGSTSKVNIYSDAGVIRLENETYYDIVEVYLSPCDDTSWGDNNLTGTIGYNEYVEWLVSPGCWDVKFYDEDGSYYIIWEIYIDIEDTYTITFVPSMKGSKNGDDVKAINALQCKTETIDKCEQKER